MDEYVAISVASAQTGIPGRTLRHWVLRGKVSAINGKAGKLVRLDDIRHVASFLGKIPGKADGNGEMRAGKAAILAGKDATDLATSARTQLDAVMTEWIAPLVEKIETQAVRIGRLEAEIEHLRVALEATERAATTNTAGTPVPMPNGAPEPLQRAPRPSWWRRVFLGEA